MGYLFSTNKEEDNLGLEWLCNLTKKKKNSKSQRPGTGIGASIRDIK